MRDLKFRAWAIPEKEMLSYDRMKKDGCLLQLAFDGVDLIPMQFTGLTDKNGKEIYEGDIVEVYWMAELGFTELEFEKNAIVIFDDCCFVAKLIKPLRTGVCEDGVYEETQHQLTKWSHDEEVSLTFEVIGNIHENGDLLND